MAESNEDAPPSTLRTLFARAEQSRGSLSTYPTTISSSYQENLASAITAYESSLRLVSELSLFSPNETLEDLSSTSLPYLLINFRLGQLVEKITGGERKDVILRARGRYERFLKVLDGYDILSSGDAKMLERYLEDPERFSTASTTDATARRNTKIARFKEEKELKSKMEYLNRNPTALQNDDDALRDLHLTHIKLCVHETFAALEGISLEMQMLAMAPPTPPPSHTRVADDERERSGGGSKDGYSERLDIHSILSATNKGPLLDKKGKPLRPFTLLDKRTQLQQGVFRPDHNLPTMSIDEYLEEERRRGGIIEGGGEKSGIRPEPDEDDLEKVDKEIEKQRRWDDWKDENPRGSGNTMNMG